MYSYVILALIMVGNASAFLKSHVQTRINGFSYETRPESLTNVLGEELEQQSFGRKVVGQRRAPLRDILGLGPAEIAVTLMAAVEDSLFDAESGSGGGSLFSLEEGIQRLHV